MGIMLLMRTLPAGFIAPCLPTKTDKLPSGSDWLHEIKHDGFRVIARKTGARCRGRLENRQCRHLERNRPNAGDPIRYACRGVNTQLYSAGLVVKGGFDVVD